MRARFALFTITNGVAACMMIAALSLLAVEAISPVHALVLAGAILWGRRLSGAVVRPILWDALAVVALLAFPFDLFIVSRSLIGAALRLLTFVVIYRCSNLSTRRELRQAVALSFVQILAAAASTTEAYFGPLLAAYLAMAIWTLMAMASARDDAPAHARRAPAGRPVLLMTSATVALGGVLFFAIPHFGTGYLQRAAGLRDAGEGLSGFSNRIELGSISRIKRSRAIVMRVRFASSPDLPPASPDLRWRGLALDTFDGRSWSTSDGDAVSAGLDRDGWFRIGPEPPERSSLVEEISIEPSLTSVLFVPPGASRVFSEDLPAVGVDAGGSLHLQGPPLHRFGYRVVAPDPDAAAAGFGADPGERIARYLTLPRVDPRVEALAYRIGQRGGSGFEKARLIEEYLRTNYDYTLDVNDAGVTDPLSHFLFERHTGHCEYFATAMAVMLRYLGIPSRVVNGFASGQWSGLAGSYIVRQSDAHSWVEAWMPSRGWVTFDPTPSDPTGGSQAGWLARASRAMDRAELMWDTWVIGLDLLDQQTLIVTLMDAARGLIAAVRRAMSWRPSSTGWDALARGAGALALLALASAGARALMARRARRARAPGEPAAAALLRQFEARWAARGVRRAPGQTPLEFAREIERRALDVPGAAQSFILSYYRARYGPARNSSTT